MSVSPIREDDLQAYVDDALDVVRETEVQLYLDSRPDESARIHAYRVQRDMLRARLAAVVREPVPSALDLAQMLEDRPVTSGKRWASTVWVQAAAAALLVCIGGAGGYLMRGPEATTGAGIGALAREARDNYTVYAPDRMRPVEMPASDVGPLMSWTSRRLNLPLNLPDLSGAGFRFIGGRLVATPHGPAALYMFDNGRGIRLVMLTRKMAIDRNSAMIEQVSNDVSTVSWSRDGLGFSLAGPLPPAVLHPIADRARSELTARPEGSAAQAELDPIL